MSLTPVPLKFGALSGSVAPPQFVSVHEAAAGAGVLPLVGVVPFEAPPMLIVCGGALEAH